MHKRAEFVKHIIVVSVLARDHVLVLQTLMSLITFYRLVLAYPLLIPLFLMSCTKWVMSIIVQLIQFCIQCDVTSQERKDKLVCSIL